MTGIISYSGPFSVYDDYKFITRAELENIGLSHLIGSNLLRGYMHGYFIDARLYHKVLCPIARVIILKQTIRKTIEKYQWRMNNFVLYPGHV